jgi:TonB family protein
MEEMLIYQGKVAIAFMVFFIAFKVLFDSWKNFRFNRLYLLGSMILSFIVPLITFTIVREVAPTFVYFESSGNEIFIAPTAVQKEEINIQQILLTLYLAGVAFFLVRLLAGHVKAISIIFKSRKMQENGIPLYIYPAEIHPFAFFSKVVVPETVLKGKAFYMILNHEMVHIREKHWLDNLTSELLCAVQWFNPFAWMMKGALKRNLEFQADNKVVASHDPETYQMALVSMANTQGPGTFLTAINSSDLKTRIKMMKMKTENKYTFVKQLVVLPLLAVLIMGLANREVKTVVGQNEDWIVSGFVSNESGEAPGISEFTDEPSNDDTPKTYEIKIIENNNLNSELVGRVLSSDTRKPVPSVKIYNKWGNKIAETKEDGTFTVTQTNLDNTVFLHAKGYAGYAKITSAKDDGAINDLLIDPVSESDKFSPDALVSDKVITKPEFPGGEAALNRFIEKSISYPGIALENGISGKVYVSFTIDKTGSVKDARIEKGVDASLDREALRVVNSLPKWKPGRVDGEIVETGYTVPVNFELPTNWLKPKIKQLELTGDPIYIVNGEEYKGHISDIKVNDILNITVLKGKEAIEKFGDKATGGVIIIETKQKKTNSGKDPLVIVNGVVYGLNIDTIDPATIERIDVLKDESATAIYGEKGQNGVILITLLSNVSSTKVESGTTNKGITIRSSDEISPTITNAQQLRRAIAERIKYPVSAQQAGQTGRIEIYAEINREGKINQISETAPAVPFETLDEVVIVAYASENPVSSTADLKKPLIDESKRVIQSFPKIEIPGLQGKWVKFQFNFLLQ